MNNVIPWSNKLDSWLSFFDHKIDILWKYLWQGAMKSCLQVQVNDQVLNSLTKQNWKWLEVSNNLNANLNVKQLPKPFRLGYILVHKIYKCHCFHKCRRFELNRVRFGSTWTRETPIYPDKARQERKVTVYLALLLTRAWSRRLKWITGLSSYLTYVKSSAI